MNRAIDRLLIATTNRGKLRELSEMLSEVSLCVVGLDEFPGLPGAEESGETFEDNARIKAVHYARLGGCWTLADDSGLCVDALGGAPGVHSARFAGCPSDDAANNRKLVALLHSVPPEKRTARFICVMVLVRPPERREGGPVVVAATRGEVAGIIMSEPRGKNGFGYDPHFLVPELGKTAAELPPERKNAISHRGQAMRRMRDALCALGPVLTGNAPLR